MQLVVSFAMALLVGTQACLGQAVAETPANAVDSRWHGAWTVATPEAHGFNAVELDRIANEFGRMQGVYSFLLISRGDLLVERYYRQGHRDKPHNLKSAGKSLISVLIGIAADKGYLRLDQPIAELLTEARAEDPAKGAITVDQLLNMTSGLETTSYGGYNRWIASENWVKAALSLPLVAEPGTFYQYSTGNTHLLSAIITAASGMSTLEFANRHLFGPMDIEVHDWQRDPQGIHIGGNNLLMTPRDMAKIGLLFLDGGRWGDQQLVSQQWIERSTRSSGLGAHEVYGTHSSLWWTDNGSDDFAAVGFGGQYIYVSRECDCVIVITSTLYSKGDDWTSQLFSLIRQRVLRRPEMPGIRYAVRDENIEPTAETLALRHALERARSELSGIVQELGAQTDMGSRFETTARVNFRSGPDKSADLLGLLENGVPVNVISGQDKWFKVRVGDRVGWLHSDFIGPAAISLDLAPEIAALRRALNRRSDQLSNVPAAVVQNSQEVSRQIASERDLARAELATLQETVARLRESLAQTQSGLGVLQDEAESNTEALQLAVSEKQVLEVSLERNRQTITILEDALRSSNTELQSAEDDLAALRSSGTERLTTLRSEAQSRAVVLEEALAGKQAVELALQNERERTARLEDLLELSNARLSSTVNDLQAARDSAEPSMNQLDEFERSNSLLKRRLEEKDSAITASESQRAALADMLSDATAELTRLQSQLEQAEAVFESDRNLLETEIAERISVAQRTESARKAAVDQLTVLQSENQSQTEALQRALSEMAATDASLVDERQRIARLEDELEASNAKLGAAQAELATVKTSATERLAMLLSETQSQTEALQSARSEKAAVDAGLVDERQRIARLEDELEASTAKLGAAQAELATVKTSATERLAMLLSETQSQTEALQSARSEKAAVDASLIDERQRIARLEDELEASNAKLGAAQAELAAATRTAAEQLAILRSENQSQTEALQSALSGKAAADAGLVDERQRIARLEDELEASNAKLGAAEAELATATTAAAEKLAILRSENQSKTAALQIALSGKAAADAGLVDQSQRIARLEDELEASNLKLGAAEARLATETKSAVDQLAILRSENQSKSEALQIALSGKAAADAGLVDERQRIARLEDELEASTAKLGAAEAELATVKTSAAERLAMLLSETQSKTEALQSARSEKAAVDASLIDERQRIARLEDELEASNAKLGAAEIELATETESAADQLAILRSENQSKTAALQTALSEKAAAAAGLVDERQRMARLESELEASNAKLRTAEAELAAATTTAVEQLAILRSENQSQTEALQSALSEKAAVDAGLVDERQRMARLESELEASNAKLRTAEAELAAATTTAVEQLAILRSENQSQTEALQSALSEKAAAAAGLVDERQRMARLEGELEASNAKLRTAEAELAAATTTAVEQLAILRSENQSQTEALQSALSEKAAAAAGLVDERQRMARLEGELEASNAKLRTAEAELAAATTTAVEQLAILRSENQSQTEALQSALSEKAAVDAGLVDERQRMARLEDELEASNAKLRTADAELAAATTTAVEQLAILRSENQSKSEALQSALSEKAAADAGLVDERQRIARLEDELNASNVKLSATANVLSAANESVVASVNRIGELEAANSSLQTQLEAQTSAVAAANAQQSAFADQLSAATAELTQRRVELDQAQAALTQSQARLSVIDAENKTQSEQLTLLSAGSERLGQALAQAESKETTLQVELDKARTEVAALESALQQSQRVANERDEARAELATLRDAVATLQASLASNEQALGATQTELATQMDAVERAESARRATVEKLAALRSEAESQSAALKRAQLEKTALETDWQEDRETIAALEDSLSSTAGNTVAAQLAMTGQLDRLRAELASTRQALEQANVANREATTELAQLRQQGAATEEALAEARGVASAQRDEAENAQQRIAELEATIVVAERQRQTTGSAHAAALVEAAERESLLRKNLGTADARRSAQTDDLGTVRESVVAAAHRIGELEAANSSLQTQLEAQTSAVAAANAQRSALDDQLSGATAELKRQRAELDQAQAALTQSQTRLAVIDTEKKTQAGQLTQLSLGSDRLGQALAQAESNEMTLQIELDKARTEVAALESALQRSQRVVIERDEARAELATLRDVVATLQSSLASNEQVLGATQTELAKQVAAVGRAESERRATVDELAALRSQAQSQAAALQRAQSDRELINVSLGQERERIVMLEDTLAKADDRRQTLAAALDKPEAEPLAITGSGSASADDVSEAGLAAVGEAIQIWSKAWSDQDVASYLAAYADDFVPEGGQTIDSWKALRRTRLNAPKFIEVSIANLAMERQGAKVVASFLQTYRSNTYSDQTRKVLELTRTADGWKIVREHAS